MSRHYTIKTFFRQVPNELLAKCFKERAVLQDFNWAKIKETRINELFDAWMELPDSQRGELEASFQEVFDLSCKKGLEAILDEANWHLSTAEEIEEFTTKLSALPGHYRRAMTVWLDYPEFWKGATLFYHADSLSYWRKRKNMGNQPAAVDKASREDLAKQIASYHHLVEGRGNNCVVECFKRRDRDYFFAYPEDHSRQDVEWVNGDLGSRLHNPAFEIVFVYSQSEGMLDINYQGSLKKLEPLQEMFCRKILKQASLPLNPEDRRVYELNVLGERDFGFVFSPQSGIQKVNVRKLRLSSRWVEGDKVTLEADPEDNIYAVHDLLNAFGKTDILKRYNITQAELAVTMQADPGKAAKTHKIRITHPNSCSLKYDEIGLKLREMLEASGIEPQEPNFEEDDALEPISFT
jgi:hypothetical protein